MKKIFICPLFWSFVFWIFSCHGTFGQEKEDKYAKLERPLTLRPDSDAWLKATIQFRIFANPLLPVENKPESLDEVFNPEYLDNVKVKLHLCFSNDYKKKLLRSSELQEIDYYQYYSSELEFHTLKIENSSKYAEFLFPASIAERDGFDSGRVTPVGYVISISYDNIPFNLSNDIVWKYGSKDIRDENTLMKFKQQAEQKCEVNDGILIPAYKINTNLLNSNPIKLSNN